MRTLIDIRETQLRELDELSRIERRSRAALIREALDAYLALRRRKQVTEAFGLWGNRKVDGLVYQDRLRGEW